jgi:methionyl-tRNA formyltransferase
MQLILCVKRDLHGAIFLNQLVPQLSGHSIHVLLSNKVRAAELDIPALAEIAYLERTLPIEHLIPLAEESGRVAEWLGFDALAKRHGYTCEIVDDINAPDLIKELSEFAPDLIISARFSHIFKADAIALPRHGIINIHPGQLPQYAGLFAPMRSIAEGRGALSFSMHFIDTGIDTGPMIATGSIPYGAQDDLLDKIAALYPMAIPALLDAINTLAAGRPLQTQVQDRQRRRYRSMPDAAEINAFLSAGNRFWHPASYHALVARFLPS